jgi:hypothetical protein
VGKIGKITHTIAFFSDDFQFETTYERMGKGTFKINHEKEEYLFYN